MIPFLDLKAQHRGLKGEIMEAVGGVIDSCQFALGNEVAAFEEEFAAAHGATYAAGVNTGTSALHLALLAAGIGPGDEVITVSHTFMATVSAIRYAGAKPVLVDIDPRPGYTMDPKPRRGRDHGSTPRRSSLVHLFTASRPTWIPSSRSRRSTI